MGDREAAIVKVIDSLASVDPAAWDACANPPGEIYNPFVSHALLHALEESGSATRTGWLGRCCWRTMKDALRAVPLSEKLQPR